MHSRHTSDRFCWGVMGDELSLKGPVRVIDSPMPRSQYHPVPPSMCRGLVRPKCQELVLALLEVDPRKRLSAEDALKHEFFKCGESGPLTRVLPP
jgi:serine/threonine protein kinase